MRLSLAGLRILVLFSSVPVAAGPWSPTNGPTGGWIFDLSTDGTALYALEVGVGMFHSNDRGNSWHPDGPIDQGHLLFRKDTAYLLDEGSIRIRPGPGAPWRGLKVTQDRDSSIQALALGLDGLVAASSYGGVYLSTDQGGHWARLKAPQASGTTVNLAVEGNCVWLGTDAGVYRSLDRGVTWSLGRPTDRDTLIQAIVSDPPFLLALAHEGVYRSSDSGSSWTRLALGRSGDNWDLGHLAHAGSRLFMTLQYRGLLVSPDHGDTWSEDGSLTGFKGIFLGMGADVYATRDGVYRSSDQGATWTGVHTGMAATSVNRLASAGPGKVAATAVGDAFGTEDGGDHWRLLSPPRGNGKIGAIANLGGYLYAIHPDYGLFRTRNLGGEWESLAVVNADFFRSEGQLFGLGPDLCFRSRTGTRPFSCSHDSGWTWDVRAPGWPGGLPTGMTMSGGSSWAMLSDSIFRYDKAMGTWRYISSSGLARKSPISMGSQGSTLLIGTWHSGMYRSPDSGRTWTVALDSAAAGGVHDFAEAGDYAFAATDSGVAGSERGGAWSLMNQGLPVVRNQPIRANALLAQGGILFAGFDRFGIWKLDLGISGIANREGTPECRAAKRWTRVSGGIGFGDGAGKPFRDAAGKALDRPAR